MADIGEMVSWIETEGLAMHATFGLIRYTIIGD